MDQMTEDLMSLKEIMSAQNKLDLFERILLSAKMVKNVLMRNMELNKDYMDHTLAIDDLHKQIRQFQMENEDIRDRLSIMEALTGTDSYFIQANYSSIKDDFQNESPENMNKLLPMLDQDSMIALIYEYNKENTILKKRIEMFERNKVTNKFMQINDGLNSTAYTTNFYNQGHNKYLNDSGMQKRELENEGDQSYPQGYRCGTSPNYVERDWDAEPMRCVIDAHELPQRIGGYQKYQMQPIINPTTTKKQMHNKRDIKTRDPVKAELRKFDSINSSLMSYEQMDPTPKIPRGKRSTTRNLTAVRKQNIYLEEDAKKDLIAMHGMFFEFYFYSTYKFQT
jgi:hypothetical protein